MFAFVVAVAFLRNIPVLLGAYAVAVLISAAARIPVLYFINRVWLFVPDLHRHRGGTGDVQLHHARPHRRAAGALVRSPRRAHRPGPRSAGLVVSRVVVSISLVVLLTLTTPWMRLLAALRACSCPDVRPRARHGISLCLPCCSASVADMYEARKARSATSIGRHVRHGGSSPVRRARSSARRTRCRRRSTRRWSPVATPGDARTLGRRGSTRSTAVWAVGVRSGDPRAARGRRAIGALADLVDATACRYAYLGRFPALDGVSLEVTPARRSPCSAPTVAASRRCSRSSTGCCSPERGRSRVR